MRKSWLLGCAVLFAAAPVQAQSLGDFAAWTGIMFTPVGGLPGIELPSGGTTDRRSQFAVQLGSWKFDGPGDRNSNFGLSWLSPVGTKARFGATLGWMQPGGGGDGVLNGGVDFGAPVWVSGTTEPTAVSIDLKSNLGFARFMGDDGTGSNTNAWSLVGSVPIKIRHTLESKSMVSGFVALGYGFGGLSDGTDSERGSRPMISLGGAFTTARGIGVHLGAQKVIIDGDPPMVWGLSGTFPMGVKK